MAWNYASRLHIKKRPYVERFGLINLMSTQSAYYGEMVGQKNYFNSFHNDSILFFLLHNSRTYKNGGTLRRDIIPTSHTNEKKRTKRNVIPTSHTNEEKRKERQKT